MCGLTEAEGTLVICDGCDSDHHLACLDPPLKEAPEGDFFCPQCITTRSLTSGATATTTTTTMVNTAEDVSSSSSSSSSSS